MVLFALPLATYWPTVFWRYGFRDDYSILREAHDEPEKVLRVCAAQARPFYGELLEWSFRRIPSIAGLCAIRALAAGLLGIVAVAFFLSLRRFKWDMWTAGLTSALLVVIPSSQILVGWAVAWPRCIALLAAMAAFHAAEIAFANGERTRAGWWVSAILLLVISAWIYPPDTMVYVPLLGATLWARRRCSPGPALRELIRHAITLLVGLDLAFTGMVVAFAQGWVPVSARVAFDGGWAGKLGWFIHAPLQDALAVVALNHDGGSRAVHRFAALIACVIAAGLIRDAVARAHPVRAWWGVSLLVLIPASFAVNLVADDRWNAYRVLLPLTMMVVIALVLALLTLGGRTIARLGLVVVVVPAVWLARRQTFSLLARPQSIELTALERGAQGIDLARHERVFILTPRPEQHVGAFVFGDEFGSLSTDSDWVPKEMLKLVLRERYPGVAGLAQRYEVTTGRDVAAAPDAAVIIDLQRLPRLR